MNKKELAILERAFAAEVEDRLPLQTNSKLAKDLVNRGFLAHDSRTFGMVLVVGYRLTNAGHIIYCMNCQGDNES